MDLILWRHAEAEEAQAGMADLERALTGKGQKQARRMGQWLDSQLPDSCRILCSPALRTLQTAEALGRKFKIHSDLAPGADPADILKAVNWPANKDTVLVVGHQPTLGQAASLLLTGDDLEWDIRKASAWWFAQRVPGDAMSVYLKAVMAADLVVK
ncbi:histidine phosphatase family protein [Duganella sp. BJB488]|uniref:SixA phosphatase family protein n=1 Tax=unclassified Duganella TaxID=2636909 RepID=UPI000E352384|nr:MULTISPECIES: histidine phosphatase family protein [unclassified Duganella]NVD74664.1 histidine phosphatase family protein [Duganella sp. BJB1802]RFP15323.1 histidine phosphatase family protein [Duganella sp. BJB489]RFP19879.1 histidine phosphatase family protein [Duganella sp. BJB488]RFP38267.1 histidine phosphatase family protein [Duganella sp. BJB480]